MESCDCSLKNITEYLNQKDVPHSVREVIYDQYCAYILGAIVCDTIYLLTDPIVPRFDPRSVWSGLYKLGSDMRTLGHKYKLYDPVRVAIQDSLM